MIDITYNSFEQFALQSNQRNNDASQHGQVMKVRDSDDFNKAMLKETNDLNEDGVFSIITMRKPQMQKTRKDYLELKRKCSPTGELIKHEDRFHTCRRAQEKNTCYKKHSLPLLFRALIVFC